MRANRFTFPNGFRYEHLEMTVTLDSAADMLITKQQRRFTTAIRRGDSCLLTQDKIFCPCCGHRTLAYDRYLSESREGEHRIPASEIRAWEMSLSLFSEDNELILQSIWNEDYFTCPRCSMTSREDQSDSEAEISIEAGKIRFTLLGIYKDISPYLFQAATRGVRLRFPLRESTVFNTRKGRVILYLQDSDNHNLLVRDVTAPNKYWLRSSAYRLLSFSALARRKLAQAFSSLRGGPLPFTRKELAMPELFLSMTQFWGHARCFLDALPLDETGAIDYSFRAIGHRIRDARKLPALYERAGLPQKKSIRRIVFENPQFFWFLREIAFFAGLLVDDNYCRAFLESIKRQNTLLIFFHLYPNTDCFFRDYAGLKGAKALLILLTRYEELDKLQAYAFRYAAAGVHQRRREQTGWQDICGMVMDEGSMISHPISVGLKFRDRMVSEYRFVWLKGRADFKRAGKVLHNCLGSYCPKGTKVVVIHKEQKTLAAVEVKNDQIVQALGPGNAELDHESELWRSLLRWAAECHFSFTESDEDEDDDLLLPF